jgi:ribonuclease PH
LVVVVWELLLGKQFVPRVDWSCSRTTISCSIDTIIRKIPKCTIVMEATILQDNGSCLSTVFTAAILALVDAGVELLDLVTSCAVAVMVQQHGRSITDNNSHDYDDMDSKVCYLVDPVEEEILALNSIWT